MGHKRLNSFSATSFFLLTKWENPTFQLENENVLWLPLQHAEPRLDSWNTDKHKAASDKSIQIKSSFLTIIDPTVSQTLQNHNCSEKSKFNRQTNKLNRVLFLFS